MTINSFPSVVIITALLILSSHFTHSAELTYPDKRYPNEEPEVFAEGFISKQDQNEFRMSVSADGSQYFYSIFDKRQNNYLILHTIYHNNRWSDPQPFKLTTLGDFEPFLTQNGNRFYFSSNRKPAKNRQDSNIWKIEKHKNKWSSPQSLPFNTSDSEWVASETLSGNIYFARFDAQDKADIYVYENTDQHNKIGRNLTTINTIDFNEFEPYVDPLERFMLFSSNRDEVGKVINLYISVNKKGIWGKPVNLGNKINNGSNVYSPTISPDGKYLFFNRDGDFYWVDFLKTIKTLKIVL